MGRLLWWRLIFRRRASELLGNAAAIWRFAVPFLLIGIIVVVVVAASIAIWINRSLAITSDNDRLVFIGDVLVGAALSLALLGSILAVQTYVVARRGPDLRIRMSILQQDKKVSWRHGSKLRLDPTTGSFAKPLMLKIELENYGQLAARNPLVEVSFFALQGLLDTTTPNGWIISKEGRIARWSNGADETIHPRFGPRIFSLDVPTLDLSGLAPGPLPLAKLPTRMGLVRVYALADSYKGSRDFVAVGA